MLTCLLDLRTNIHRVMGQSQPQSNYRTTSATTPARSKPNPDDYKYYVEWEDERFAEGRFRYAIKGTWLRPREKEGQKCVVKTSEVILYLAKN